MLQGKKILLGVSGSIAAYKAAFLVRLLIKEGAEVQVLMTAAAADFISPLTLATLSRHPVYSGIADGDHWHNHVKLGRWADLMVVAPASANTMAKMAHGQCDNLLLAVYLSASCPVMFAPAMDEDMWHHPTTRLNLQQLLQFGHIQLPVEKGELASGLTGEGRMAEPEMIVSSLKAYFSAKLDLEGKKALITAGPTYEPIDPVRFIGNFSSGKMGIAIADELAQRGASVQLVLGPSQLKPVHPAVKVWAVTTASEMHAICLQLFPDVDIAVLAAAVADYRPREVADQKIKKTDAPLILNLEKNADILKDLGSQKKAGQYLVGFALETENAEENARQKMKAKNADLMILNSLHDAGAGFMHDTNKVTLFDQNGRMERYPLQSKAAVARDIVNYIKQGL